MDHPIYKAIVLVHNQEDCDVAREICLKYSLPVWEEIDLGFEYIEEDDDDVSIYLRYRKDDRGDSHTGFYVDNLDGDDFDDYNRVSIEEFESLANDLNPIHIDINDILSKIKEINNILNNK
jgi:hypothetical protein